jgi:uncharacterized protein involved in exopolysaccharide biosynthesis
MSQQSPVLDLGFLVPMLARVFKVKTFYAVLLTCLALTVAVTIHSRPIYRSEAVLLYQDRGGGNPLIQREVPSPKRIGVTLKEMLYSRALLESLVKEFDLYREELERWGMVASVEQLQKYLQFNAREGYTFRISFDSNEPNEAQSVAARAAERLIRALTDARVQEAKETEAFLEGERSRVEKELRKNESELALFVAQHPEAVETLRGSAGQTTSSSADSASLGLEMQALQLKQRLAQLRQAPAQPSSDPSRGVAPKAQSEARLRAEAELTAAQHELAEKRMQFTDEYPDVKRAVARVATAKANLRHLDESAMTAPAISPPTTPAAPAPRAGDHPEVRLVQEQIDLIEKQVRSVRSQARTSIVRSGGMADPTTLGRLRAQYTELDRRARESREHHDLLENRQFQAEMQSLFATQAKRGDLVIVDPAYLPVVPVRSPRRKIAAGGVAGSAVLALAIGLLVVLRDDRLRKAADLRRFKLPPLLCEVPPP